MTMDTEERFDEVPRPASLDQFIGQEALKQDLAVYIESARRLGAPLDHVLLSGPPGLGKTTIAGIIAAETGGNMRFVAAPAIAKPSDLVSSVMGLTAGDVLFVDEIHRLPAAAEELLYPVMEDFRLDIVVGGGDGSPSRAVSIDVPRFTLVGATTRPGALTAPLRDRFGIPMRLEPYSEEELARVVVRAAASLDLDIEAEAAASVAARSRGTPRIALRLLRRVRDFAVAGNDGKADIAIAEHAMDRFGIDRRGFDPLDRRYVDVLTKRFRGGPVGVSTLAAAIGESVDTLENSVEPYLIRAGYVERTARGRVLSQGTLFSAA